MPQGERMPKGTSRPRQYKSTFDDTGKVGKENFAIKSFWRQNKMEDVIQLTPEELDIKIEEALEVYAEIQRADNPNWWYPDLGGRTITEARYKKKLDK
jgi:hypothetical protein